MEKDLVFEKYYDFLEEKNEYSPESEELYLKFLISLNNYVYEPYISLMELYLNQQNIEKAKEIIELAYKRVMYNEFNNEFPKKLDYYEIQNRGIFRTIYNFADFLWFNEQKKEALDLFNRLLELNPDDNMGIRYAICGMKNGYSSSRHVWSEHGNNIEEWYKREK